MSEDRAELLKRFQEACATAQHQREAKKALRRTLVADDAIKQILIADLKRVYDHPDNPYRGFAASRKRYRELGWYPEIVVTDVFGNHEEFLRAAGLADSRTTTRVRNKGALLHSHQQIAAYADRELKPFHNAFQSELPEGVFHVVVGSDFHSSFVDPFALRVWKDVLRIVNPSQVVLNGDVFDFPQISRHRKLPGHFSLSLQEEIEFGREKILRPTREACPDANILFVIGNHEYRLVNYLADVAPQLADLAVYDASGAKIPLSFSNLFGLESLKIGLVCRQNFLAPYEAQRKRELAENWVVIADCLAITHGTSTAQFAAAEQLKTYQMSGTSGHTHRPQTITANSLATGTLSWTSTPMMASFAVGRDYVSEPSSWTMGFAVFTVDTNFKRVIPQLILIHEDFASFAGHVWSPTKEEREERLRLWS